MPKIMHSSPGLSQFKSDKTKLIRLFAERRMLPVFNRLAPEIYAVFQEAGKDLPTAELRKRLRDAVKRALEDREDRANDFYTSGQDTKRGCEPEIAVYAALIDALISEELQRLISHTL